MSASINNAAFDRAVEPVIKILSHDQVVQIADFHADDELQQRIQELAGRANEGDLSPEESSEYEGYAQANRFIAILQAKARRLLSTTTDS